MSANIGFTEAFAKYKAKLVNANWAVSSISENNELVISCWHNYFKKGINKGQMLYVDSLSRWTSNTLGNKLLADHLVKAINQNIPVRVVIATAEDPSLIEKVTDASKIKKRFSVREDLVGKVTDFDGNYFTIEFK